MMITTLTRSTNAVLPYLQLMRFHRPVGIWLLLWPTLWSLCLASRGLPSWHWLMIFTLGTVVMRAAGCVINDLMDYRFDKHVARTKLRPLAAGTLSPRQGLITFALLCLLGAFFWWQLPWLAQQIGLIALALSMFYPLTKRFFPCPQVILGLAWYLGMIMAYATVLLSIPPIAWFVYLTAVVWTLAYDTQYALADKEDDAKLGLSSSARWFGTHAMKMIVLFQILFMSMMYYIGYYYHLAWYYNLALFFAALGFIYQYFLMRQHKYLQAFTHNQWVGLVIFIGILSM